MRTKEIGEISEAIILSEFLKAGFPVLLPFGDNQRYDMVIEVAGSFLRVQCKTAYRAASDGGSIRFNAKSSNPPNRSRLRGYRGQADLFAAYSPDTRQVYVLAVDEVPETDVWLRVAPTRNHQEHGVRWAQHHTLEAWAARSFPADMPDPA